MYGIIAVDVVHALFYLEVKCEDETLWWELLQSSKKSHLTSWRFKVAFLCGIRNIIHVPSYIFKLNPPFQVFYTQLVNLFKTSFDIAGFGDTAEVSV